MMPSGALASTYKVKEGLKTTSTENAPLDAAMARVRYTKEF